VAKNKGLGPTAKMEIMDESSGTCLAICRDVCLVGDWLSRGAVVKAGLMFQSWSYAIDESQLWVVNSLSSCQFRDVSKPPDQRRHHLEPGSYVKHAEAIPRHEVRHDSADECCEQEQPDAF